MDFNDLSYDFKNSCITLKNDKFMVYAHKNELLNEHIIKTQYIFHSLLDENVLLNFYEYFQNNNFINLSYSQFREIIDISIAFHDIGKISPKFQINKLNKNNNLKELQLNFLRNHNLQELKDNFVSNHSFSSALSFLAKLKDDFDENSLFLICLTYAINGHHTKLNDILKKEGFSYNSFEDNLLYSISCLILFLKIGSKNQIENGEFYQSFFQNFQDLAIDSKTPYNSNFSFFYNYIYSLLITSDVLASREYYKSINQVKKIDFNKRISENLKNKMIKTFNDVPFNKNLDCENFLEDISSFKEIDLLRRNMVLESSFNLKNFIDSNVRSNIFYLNMPTGGGKTNTSMKLALDLIENTSANRIIYAMPFINIIEQNYDVICKNFGLNEDFGEIRKIYSASETLFDEKDISNIILSDSFFNYPVICTTFSTLFNSFIYTFKRNKYKISALTNSIVILDEIQSLPLDNWISLYYLISEMSQRYNIYFIIMSATLPNFEKLKLDSRNELKCNPSFSLIKSPEKYFNHYLFDRTQIVNNIIDLSVNDEKYLKRYLFEKIIKPNFENGFKKCLIVLNTIKTSRLIFDLLKEYEGEFDIDLLNSSLLPSVKQNIIYKINNMKKDNKKYILVSTQSIEAGVDVSFDFVIRDFSILDSIEQVRGRCNRSRELNKFDQNKKGNIYLINLKNKNIEINSYIYNDNEIKTRIKETKNLFSNTLDYNYNDIKKYYDNVSSNINNLMDDKEQEFIINDRENIKHWNLMEYSKLNEIDGINIIDNKLNQYSIFIPINIGIFNDKPNFENIHDIDDKELENLYLENKKNFVFSQNEIKYLKNIEKNENYVIFNKLMINGNNLIKYYKNLIENSKEDYIQSKILKKEFSSILYKFIINISIGDEDLELKIETFEKIGYFYVLPLELVGNSEEELYSIKFGFNYNPKITEIL
ncbi:MAG: CRISPR-associated helicase Cas3' [Firmicutes bacterium]|nr:CRISPR-associated helicase Cas3' [Bacillota bacterium]